jgi:hypothetical protein
MPALVGDLVEADPGQPLERVVEGTPVGDHPFDDGADALPSDAQQLAHRGFGGVGDQPGHGVVEITRVTGTMSGPGDLGDGRSVHRALHPRGIGLEEAPERPEIEGPPVAPPLALVIARCARTAAPAAALG